MTKILIKVKSPCNLFTIYRCCKMLDLLLKQMKKLIKNLKFNRKQLCRKETLQISKYLNLHKPVN